MRVNVIVVEQVTETTTFAVEVPDDATDAQVAVAARAAFLDDDSPDRESEVTERDFTLDGVRWSEDELSIMESETAAADTVSARIVDVEGYGPPRSHPAWGLV